MISKVSGACLPQFLRFQSISKVLRKVVNHNVLSSRYVISILIIFLVLLIDASVSFRTAVHYERNARVEEHAKHVSAIIQIRGEIFGQTDSLRRNIVSSPKLIYAPKNDILRTKSESNAVRLVAARYLKFLKISSLKCKIKSVPGWKVLHIVNNFVRSCMLYPAVLYTLRSNAFQISMNKKNTEHFVFQRKLRCYWPTEHRVVAR